MRFESDSQNAANDCGVGAGLTHDDPLFTSSLEECRLPPMRAEREPRLR